MFAPFRLHLVKLLLLIVVQECFDLRSTTLVNALHLAEPVLAGQRRVIANLLHLLTLVFEDGFQLCLLVVAQAQFLSHVLNLIVDAGHGVPAHTSVHPSTLTGLIGSSLTLGVLTESDS
jgi:hypothetical protein